MKNFKASSAWERGAGPDLWRRTLSQIPSVYGRLVYLASLRDRNSGFYMHQGLAAKFGDHESDRVLRESHISTFAEWLRFSLEQQKADLDLHLSALDTNKRTTIETWLKSKDYTNLVPVCGREMERTLYEMDLEALLQLISYELGVSWSDPNA